MDQELRSLLIDLSVHLSNIINNRNPNDRDCACTDILNNVSRALRDFGEKLGDRPPIHATTDYLNAQSGNIRPSKRPHKVLTQEAEKTPENPTTSNSGNQTEETSRPKRKCTMNLNPFVKLTRIDVSAYLQELDRSNSRFDKEEANDAQRSVSQSDADLRSVNARPSPSMATAIRAQSQAEYRATEVEAHFEEVALVPEVVPIGGSKVASTHLMKHGADLYKCMLCDDEKDSIYFTEAQILDHFTDKAAQHKDAQAKPTFQYFHRDNELNSTVSEITIDKFICATCNHESDKAADALEHFKKHRDQMVDFKVLATVKSSEFDGDKVICSSYVAKQDKYILRQCFLCMKCKNNFPSKGLLLAHHNTSHPHEMLEVTLDRPVLIALNEENASEYQSTNEQFDRFMTYSCYWCRDNSNNDNEEQLIGADAKTIREHWLAEHVDDENDPTERPFRFYVEPLVKCNYCNIISTYKGLRKHTTYKPSKLPICFTNINANDECPLCDFQGERLAAHISVTHADILTMNMVNPNRLSEEAIVQLLRVDVHRKPMCGLCDELFNLEIDYKKHLQLKHVGQQALRKEVIDGRFEILVCGCCDLPIPSRNFIQHFKMHRFNYSCRRCNVKLVGIDEAARHDYELHGLENAIERRFISFRRKWWNSFQHTKCIFGNGAVLYECNLQGSKYDGTTAFDHFIRTKENEHRATFAKLLQAKSASQNKNR